MFDRLTNFLLRAIDFLQTYNGAVNAVATVFIAAFTIVLAIISRRQAALTKASVRIAERSLTELQRAIVAPIRFDIDQMHRNRRQVIGYRVGPSQQNFGATIAKKFMCSANFVAWDGDLPDDFAYADRIVIPRGTGYLAPRVICPQPVAIAIKDLLDIRDEKKRGFLYGWVEYVDIFNPDIWRRTEFCVEVKVIGNLLEMWPPGIRTHTLDILSMARATTPWIGTANTSPASAHR